ncbi:MAG: hypothetical protein ACQEVA_15060 [Myxococcota bacterium]
MNIRRFAAISALCLTLLLSASATAQEFTQGARPAGLGQAYTAVSTGASGIYHNPAGIARAVMYSLEGSFEYTPDGSVLNAAVMDSKTNPELGAGVAYSYFLGRGDNDVNGHDIHLGLALPVLPDRISLGLGGRWIIATVDGVQIINQPTVSAGALFRVSEMIHLGLAGKNLIDVCSDDQQCGDVAPTLIALGASFGNETNFLISSDLEMDLTSDPDSVALNVDAGAEYMIGEIVPIRAGYQYKGVDATHFVTGGLGWRSNQAGVDAGFRINPADPGIFYAVASFSLYL